MICKQLSTKERRKPQQNTDGNGQRVPRQFQCKQLIHHRKNVILLKGLNITIKAYQTGANDLCIVDTRTVHIAVDDLYLPFFAKMVFVICCNHENFGSSNYTIMFNRPYRFRDTSYQ